MKNYNVEQYGNTRWNRLGDKIEWIMDVFVAPIFMMLLMGVCVLFFSGLLIALFVALLLEVI